MSIFHFELHVNWIKVWPFSNSTQALSVIITLINALKTWLLDDKEDYLTAAWADDNHQGQRVQDVQSPAFWTAEFYLCFHKSFWSRKCRLKWNLIMIFKKKKRWWITDGIQTWLWWHFVEIHNEYYILPQSHN